MRLQNQPPAISSEMNDAKADDAKTVTTTPQRELAHGHGRRRRQRQAIGQGSLASATQASHLRLRTPPATTVQDAPSSSTQALTSNPQSSSSNPANAKLSLPRTLPRPQTRQVESSAIEAINAKLSGVPIEYVRDQIETRGRSLLAMVGATVPDRSFTTLPQTVDVIVRECVEDIPTHILAVHSSKSPHGAKKTVHLYSVHNLVLAAHCANLPSLPISFPYQPDKPNTKVTLPLVPLCIPSPDTFPILQAYLYTKRADRLLAAFLPVPPAPSDRIDLETALQRLSRRLYEQYGTAALLRYVTVMHGVWANVVALGVFDAKLWGALDLAWKCLMDALSYGVGTPAQGLGLDTGAPLTVSHSGTNGSSRAMDTS